MTNPDARFDRSSGKRTWPWWSGPFANCSRLAPVVFLAASVTAPAQPSSTKDKGVNFYSLPQEQAIGRAAAEEFSKGVTLLRTPAVADYLTQLGKDLSAVAPGAQYSYTFTAFRGHAAIPAAAFPANDAGAMEPLTLPGGPIFLSIDLVGKLGEESDLAAVLAHAVAHVALRHSTRTATRADIADMAARTAPPGVAPMISIGFQKITRGFETQADVLAVRIMAEAGYDPVGLLNYLRKLPPLAQIDRASSPVPAPQTRMQVVEDAIRALPQTTYRPDSGQFALWKLAVGTPDSQ